jgi:UPF0271 protein
MLSIDFNCDMGEGMSSDEDIMPFVSSVNIACGLHAGDVDTMRRTIGLALKYGVAIGAHPSYPDREHFGRKDCWGISVGPDNLASIITDQLGLLQNLCDESGARMHHVKPHGALYNRAAWDPEVSTIIGRAILALDPTLLLYGLSGSEMKHAADRCGLHFINEVFADRTYQEDGSLTPRTLPGALIDNPVAAAGQVLTMIEEGSVVTLRGKKIALTAETLCIHGDGREATGFARMIYSLLTERGVFVRLPALPE